MDYDDSRRLQRKLTQLEDNAVSELEFWDMDVTDEYCWKFQERLANNTSLTSLKCKLSREVSETANESEFLLDVTFDKTCNQKRRGRIRIG
jgi:aminopeptidase C